MKSEDLADLETFKGMECLYIERPMIFATKVIDFEIVGENITVRMLTTSPLVCKYKFFQKKDEDIADKWLPSPHAATDIWKISMPIAHAFIESSTKIYFGSNYGMGMRLYFIPEFVERFKEKDLSWWGELENYGRVQRSDESE